MSESEESEDVYQTKRVTTKKQTNVRNAKRKGERFLLGLSHSI